MNIRTAERNDTATVADLLDEATRWVHELGFEHQGDLVLDGRDMSLYQRPVHP